MLNFWASKPAPVLLRHDNYFKPVWYFLDFIFLAESECFVSDDSNSDEGMWMHLKK